MVEYDGYFYSGASLAYKGVPFFAATIEEIDEDDEDFHDYRCEMEGRLHDALVEAQENYVTSLWMQSHEFSALFDCFDSDSPCISSDLVPWAAPGYKIHWQEHIILDEELYIIVTIYYNSVPLVIISHPQVSLSEIDQVLPKIAERVRCEIDINEINLKPDIAFVAEIVEPVPAPAPVFVPSPAKPKLRRNHNRHIDCENVIGSMGERVTRSRSRRA